jgi:hypothetical protein
MLSVPHAASGEGGRASFRLAPQEAHQGNRNQHRARDQCRRAVLRRIKRRGQEPIGNRIVEVSDDLDQCQAFEQPVERLIRADCVPSSRGNSRLPYSLEPESRASSSRGSSAYSILTPLGSRTIKWILGPLPEIDGANSRPFRDARVQCVQSRRVDDRESEMMEADVGAPVERDGAFRRLDLPQGDDAVAV